MGVIYSIPIIDIEGRLVSDGLVKTYWSLFDRTDRFIGVRFKYKGQLKKANEELRSIIAEHYNSELFTVEIQGSDQQTASVTVKLRNLLDDSL